MTSVSARTPESDFAARLAADPGSPLVTFYDHDTGERAELSAKSMGNWVAKTYFLLVDELGLGVGDRAFVRMPVHWLAAPIIYGCWFAGLEVSSTPEGAAVAFGDVDSLDGVDLTSVDEIFAVSLLSMARSGEPPAGMQDYAAAVRPQPDAWATVHPIAAPSDPGLDGGTRSELLADAVALADDLGLDPGDRLMFAPSEPGFGPEAWLAALLAPVSVGGSTVLVRNAAEEKLEALIESERAVIALR
ncbi:MAG: hypothetical protein JWN95_2478 [Frankiales bacterium]|nr:hypothetical protein [Frankiales bacterium]